MCQAIDVIGISHDRVRNRSASRCALDTGILARVAALEAHANIQAAELSAIATALAGELHALSGSQLWERITHALEHPPAVNAAPRLALSPGDAAEFLGVETATIEHLMRTRRLAFVQVGEQRGRTILVKDLLAFAESQRQAIGAESQRRRRGSRSAN